MEINLQRGDLCTITDIVFFKKNGTVKDGTSFFNGTTPNALTQTLTLCVCALASRLFLLCSEIAFDF